MYSFGLISLLIRATGRLLYPAACVRCNETLSLVERVLCRPCTRSLAVLAGPLCRTCARPLPPYALAGKRCRACKKSKPALERLLAAVPFDDVHRPLIHEIKFRRRRWVLSVYKPLIEKTLRAAKIDKPDLVVPVPMDRARRREREFNQAEDLARLAAAYLDTRVGQNAIRRRSGRKPQSTLTRKERTGNLRGQFFVPRPKDVRHQSVLLVDDIYTTGTTLNECAAALKTAGASHVSGFVLARAIPRMLHGEAICVP